MTKIKISYFKLYIFIVAISTIDLFFTDSFQPVPKDSFIIIQTALLIVFIASFLIQKKSSLGLYVNKNGFIWRTRDNEFHYHWDVVKIKVLINFMSFTVVELSTDKNPKHRLLISWLMERKGLEEIESVCPESHPLYKYLKKYK